MKKLPEKIRIPVICASAAALVAASLFAARKIIAARTLDSTTYQVRAETYENVIEIAGTVAAAQEQTLQALGDGTVMGVYVSEGDRVKKGDLIIQLDDTTEKYNLAKLDYDMAAARITGSDMQVELMRTQRLSLVQKVADRKVVATFDGVIAELDVSAGDSMEAKDSVGTLVNVDYLTAEVEIPETDVTKLRAGQKVEFTFPACDRTVEGYVTGWPAIGTVTSRGATVVKAELRIDDYPEAILPNFSFTGKIRISEPEEYLVVERYAVGYDNGAAYVELARTGQRISVEARPYGSDYVKIVGGLSGGEILKAQSQPRSSGWNRRNGPGGAGGGMPGGGMGGGPPPGGGR